MPPQKKYIDNPVNPRVKLLYSGNTYRFYVNNGLIDHDYQADETVIKEIDDDDKEELENLKQMYKNEDFFVVRGRGMYSRYWVKYYRKNGTKKPVINGKKNNFSIVYKDKDV